MFIAKAIPATPKTISASDIPEITAPTTPNPELDDFIQQIKPTAVITHFTKKSIFILKFVKFITFIVYNPFFIFHIKNILFDTQIFSIDFPLYCLYILYLQIEGYLEHITLTFLVASASPRLDAFKSQS